MYFNTQFFTSLSQSRIQANHYSYIIFSACGAKWTLSRKVSFVNSVFLSVVAVDVFKAIQKFLLVFQEEEDQLVGIS